MRARVCCLRARTTTQVSNVDRAILELMAAVRFPPPALDMYGDVYSPCPTLEDHTNFTADSAKFYDLEEA